MAEDQLIAVDVILPNEDIVEMTISKSCPMIDFLIHVTSKFNLRPSDHIIEAFVATDVKDITRTTEVISYQPNTPIGTIHSKIFKIRNKKNRHSYISDVGAIGSQGISATDSFKSRVQSFNDLSRVGGPNYNKAPTMVRSRSNYITSTLPPQVNGNQVETLLGSYRLSIHLPYSQLRVMRVKPSQKVAEIVDIVCEESNLNMNKYRVTTLENVEVDCGKTFGEYHNLSHIQLVRRESNYETEVQPVANRMSMPPPQTGNGYANPTQTNGKKEKFGGLTKTFKSLLDLRGSDDKKKHVKKGSFHSTEPLPQLTPTSTHSYEAKIPIPPKRKAPAPKPPQNTPQHGGGVATLPSSARNSGLEDLKSRSPFTNKLISASTVDLTYDSEWKGTRENVMNTLSRKQSSTDLSTDSGGSAIPLPKRQRPANKKRAAPAPPPRTIHEPAIIENEETIPGENFEKETHSNETTSNNVDSAKVEVDSPANGPHHVEIEVKLVDTRSHVRNPSLTAIKTQPDINPNDIKLENSKSTEKVEMAVQVDITDIKQEITERLSENIVEEQQMQNSNNDENIRPNTIDEHLDFTHKNETNTSEDIFQRIVATEETQIKLENTDKQILQSKSVLVSGKESNLSSKVNHVRIKPEPEDIEESPDTLSSNKNNSKVTLDEQSSNFKNQNVIKDDAPVVTENIRKESQSSDEIGKTEIIEEVLNEAPIRQPALAGFNSLKPVKKNEVKIERQSSDPLSSKGMKFNVNDLIKQKQLLTPVSNDESKKLLHFDFNNTNKVKESKTSENNQLASSNVNQRPTANDLLASMAKLKHVEVNYKNTLPHITIDSIVKNKSENTSELKLIEANSELNQPTTSNIVEESKVETQHETAYKLELVNEPIIRPEKQEIVEQPVVVKEVIRKPVEQFSKPLFTMNCLKDTVPKDDFIKSVEQYSNNDKFSQSRPKRADSITKKYLESVSGSTKPEPAVRQLPKARPQSMFMQFSAPPIASDTVIKSYSVDCPDTKEPNVEELNRRNSDSVKKTTAVSSSPFTPKFTFTTWNDEKSHKVVTKIADDTTHGSTMQEPDLMVGSKKKVTSTASEEIQKFHDQLRPVNRIITPQPISKGTTSTDHKPSIVDVIEKPKPATRITPTMKSIMEDSFPNGNGSKPSWELVKDLENKLEEKRKHMTDIEQLSNDEGYEDKSPEESESESGSNSLLPIKVNVHNPLIISVFPYVKVKGVADKVVNNNNASNVETDDPPLIEAVSDVKMKL